MGKTFALSLVVCAACANTVSQDRSTGPDGRIKGAKEVSLEEGGEGKARGVVTYPGGDRVDWRVIKLPETKRGTLDLEMTYTTPRPGLKVTFDVFDQWNVPVKQAALGRGRVKAMKIDKAKGTYWIRVYAPRRGDAGAYKLTAAFVADPDMTFTPPVVPDPPRLADIPAPLPTSCPTHDPSNPTCKEVCAPGAPASWKACLPPPPPVTPAEPLPVVKLPDPIKARVLKNELDDTGGVLLTLGAGSELGVTKAWKGQLLKGETAARLSGGQMQIIRIDKRTMVVRVSVRPDVVAANPFAVLTPE